jgi:thiosulfate/3-mercaptopyruvate sulfurtransferase
MISAEELNALMGDENLIIVGVISPSAALVPFSNAANPVNGSYLVWTGDFLASGNDEALSTEIGLFRPKLADMETLMSKAGAMQDSLIVVYSSDWLSQGARVAWNLSMLGLNVRFLDGGVEAWRAIHGRTGNSKRLPDQSIKTDFRAPNYSPGACDVSIDMVIEALQNPDEWVVIDTRDLAEYEGKKTDSSGGAYGTGRMKGAVHIQWETAQDSKGKLLSRDELMGIYGFIGDRKVIVFCQGGVRSAYTWIVLKDLGFDVYNYDGSWLEWSYAVSDYSSYPKDVVLGLTEEWKDYGKPI